MQTTTLILPGIGNSDGAHWQTLWQTAHKNFIRVQQRDWDNPVCAEWIENLEKAVTQIDGEIVLVAHSLGCLLVTHWAAQTEHKIKGALLVAPPNPSETVFPKTASGFSPFPLRLFKFPSMVVASSNDSYGDPAFAQSCATAWGSQFVNIGAVGHINSDSGLDLWPEGFALYRKISS